MDDTLRGAARPVNMENVGELISELLELVRVLRPIADKVLAADHLFEAPGRKPRSQRDDLEARAIVLAATMPKPSYGKIAKILDVPKSTLSYWPNLKVAFDERYRRTGEAKRGFRNADGSVDGRDDDQE